LKQGITDVFFVTENFVDGACVPLFSSGTEGSTGTTEESNPLSGAASAGWNPLDLNATLEPSMSCFFRMLSSKQSRRLFSGEVLGA